MMVNRLWHKEGGLDSEILKGVKIKVIWIIIIVAMVFIRKPNESMIR